MKFKSKIDWWFNGILLLMCAITAYVFISALTTGYTGLFASGFILLFLDLVFIVPVYFFTYYEITEDTLLIKSGLAFKKTIKISDIVGVAPTHNPVSSAALSINRIAIFYNKGKRIANEYISPADKEKFIEELVKLKPDIIVKRG